MTVTDDSGPTHIIELAANEHSKITHVNLYSLRAEIVRVFTFDAPAGQNSVVISGLPNFIPNTLRYERYLAGNSHCDLLSNSVEGRGNATIHDVTQTVKWIDRIPSKSPNLAELDAKLSSNSQAQLRANKRIDTLDTYMSSIDTQHTSVEQLGAMLSLYDEQVAAIQNQLAELAKVKSSLEEQRQAEYKAYPAVEGKSGRGTTIGVYVPETTSLKLALIYGA